MRFGRPCPGCTALESERDFLRAELRNALDHNRRLERIQAGASELPVVPRKPMEPIPADLREKINAFESQHIRSELERGAIASFQRHQSWDRAHEKLDETLAGMEEG